MLHRKLVLIAATAGLACASAAPAGAACSSGAADKPDLGFVDSNCDGIDGDKATALFVTTNGDDNNPGSFASPMKTIQAAVTAGLAAGKDVYVGGGTYPGKVAFLGANGNIGVYGGYDPQTWQRSAANVTTIEAQGQVVGFGAHGIVLQLLTVDSTAPTSGLASYGVRGFNSGSIALSRVAIHTAKGADGAEGAPSPPAPARAPDGSTGTYNNCSTWAGPGGTGEGYIWGGWGGDQQDQQFPMKGHDGKSDPNDPIISGGMGGTSYGQSGGQGTSGHQGIHGAGGSDFLARTSSFFQAVPGSPGTAGTRGAGGGGGAAGADLCLPGSGGGAGGLPGVGGKGGQGGGGSIGVFAGTGARVVVLDGSTIQTSDGGHGGYGAPGQPSGLGGLGGNKVSRFDGYTTHTSGAGGNGGSGGQGGRGGGGAGGASVGVLAVDGLAVVSADTTITVGAGGAGGNGANDGRPGVAQKNAQVTTPGGSLPAPGDFDGDGITDDADGCPIAAGSINGCPSPEETPTGPVAGDPTATAAGGTTSGSGTVAVSVLPAAGCVDKRVFTIRINPRKAHIKTARLVLDGRRLKVVKRSARRWTAKADLRRSTRTSHTLTIRGKLRGGKRYKQVRRYRTCGA